MFLCSSLPRGQMHRCSVSSQSGRIASHLDHVPCQALKLSFCFCRELITHLSGDQSCQTESVFGGDTLIQTAFCVCLSVDAASGDPDVHLSVISEPLITLLMRQSTQSVTLRPGMSSTAICPCNISNTPP